MKSNRYETRTPKKIKGMTMLRLAVSAPSTQYNENTIQCARVRCDRGVLAACSLCPIFLFSFLGLTSVRLVPYVPDTVKSSYEVAIFTKVSLLCTIHQFKLLLTVCFLSWTGILILANTISKAVKRPRGFGGSNGAF